MLSNVNCMFVERLKDSWICDVFFGVHFLEGRVVGYILYVSNVLNLYDVPLDIW